MQIHEKTNFLGVTKKQIFKFDGHPYHFKKRLRINGM